jgi:hypothetical protein
MNISELKTRKTNLEREIKQLLNNFEKETETTVHFVKYDWLSKHSLEYRLKPKDVQITISIQ